MAAKTGKGYSKHGDRYRVLVRENGKAHWVSFQTEKEAAAYFANQQSPVMKAYRNYQRTGEIIPTAKVVGPTVVEYGREVFAARDLKRNTQEMYANALRRIEREPLGSMEVTTVGPRDIRMFFGAVEKNRANVKAVLDMTFTTAKREGMTVSRRWKLRRSSFQPARRALRHPGSAAHASNSAIRSLPGGGTCGRSVSRHRSTAPRQRTDARRADQKFGEPA
jgi:hypothetical protein